MNVSFIVVRERSEEYMRVGLTGHATAEDDDVQLAVFCDIHGC
jgi:hypothetical protein